jgi:hypothetical protein
MDRQIARYRDTGFQENRGTKVHRDTEIQRYKDTRIQRYKDTEIRRYKGTEIARHTCGTMNPPGDPCTLQPPPACLHCGNL